MSLYLNDCETFASYNSELLPQSGAPWWFIDNKGRLNFHIEGQDRTVGPCPEGRVTDMQWHHLAVTRTTDDAEVTAAPGPVTDWSIPAPEHRSTFSGQ